MDYPEKWGHCFCGVVVKISGLDVLNKTKNVDETDISKPGTRKSKQLYMQISTTKHNGFDVLTINKTIKHFI